MNAAPVLILASASPRRTQLLTQIGVPHRVVPAHIDERRSAQESIEHCVLRLAEHKALAVQAMLTTAEAAAPAHALPVLGADTLVTLDGELLGKPRDRNDAFAMWRRLSGRTHEVWSAVALATAAGIESRLARSEVRLRVLDESECAAYWDSGEPRDKAGAYAIQGLAAVFVAELRGSYSGVMGLPLYETAQLLGRAGVACWAWTGGGR